MKRVMRRAAASVLAAVMAVGLMATPAWAGKSVRDFEVKSVVTRKVHAKVHVEWTYNKGRVLHGVQRYNGSFKGTVVNTLPKSHDVWINLEAETGEFGRITLTKKGSFSGEYVDLQGAYFWVCSSPKGTGWDAVCSDTR
ncbi:hypothetical protein GCM10022247_71930 [Allokutzneria multivorans]|uniref:Uncharacterized protein n=1 Tax=Allokutzneria multivorans TaxID=1142134 RepID=A0ABP7U4U2_9PSEU